MTTQHRLYIAKQHKCADCGDPCASKRCPACAVAASNNSLYTGSAVDSQRKGRLPVTCWCERTTVFVPKEKLAEGLTESCGAPGCRSAA